MNVPVETNKCKNKINAADIVPIGTGSMQYLLSSRCGIIVDVMHRYALASAVVAHIF